MKHANRAATLMTISAALIVAATTVVATASEGLAFPVARQC